MEAQGTNAPNLDKQLSEAAQNLNLDLCKELLQLGADPKKVFLEGGNGWYEGNSSTALYNIVDKFYPKGRSPEQHATFVDIVELLLANGADPDFKARRGNWNGCTYYPVFDKATQMLGNLHSGDLKVKFLLAFVNAGVELNKRIRKGKQKSSYGYGSVDYPIFNLVKQVGPDEPFEIVKTYINAGVNVNCTQSSWAISFDPYGDEESEYDSNTKSYVKVLHEAILTGNLELVRFLLDKGAEINHNMVVTRKEEGKHVHWVLSSVQIAMDLGHDNIVELLLERGGKEIVEDDGRGPGRYGKYIPRYYKANNGKGILTQKDEEDS